LRALGVLLVSRAQWRVCGVRVTVRVTDGDGDKVWSKGAGEGGLCVFLRARGGTATRGPVSTVPLSLPLSLLSLPCSVLNCVVNGAHGGRLDCAGRPGERAPRLGSARLVLLGEGRKARDVLVGLTQGVRELALFGVEQP